MVDPINHKEVHSLLVEVALAAGDMILAAQPHIATVGTKQNSADLVTETDKAVEQYVITTLKGKYPELDFLGEETYTIGKKLTNKPTFICDPIDGTVNFVHTLPNVCISLALAIHKKPVVGVVYNPYTTHLYSAIKGQGSFLTMPVLLQVQAPSQPQPSPTRGTGINWNIKYETFAKLAGGREQGGKMVHSLRSMGSAALNFCAVAAGQIDVYWEGGCWAWDVAAGWLILTEAGGIVVDANPGNWSPTIDGRRYMAVRAAPAGQREIVEEFWSIIPEGGYDYSS
ncbi:unnamed protein product [Tuber melanosporum]|uniref:Inositol-1-monophosphatase n=1 Tax=Tuber melanosporum (strain Mel28) TaxID=656061 RepID=D5GMW5_TUBMM|nr:uncharacterized protein GSTUM_00010971001 [Tuber melanosporum]CAZ85858.1 unnamed protein product [Tuber melanosporum]